MHSGTYSVGYGASAAAKAAAAAVAAAPAAAGSTGGREGKAIRENEHATMLAGITPEDGRSEEKRPPAPLALIAASLIRTETRRAESLGTVRLLLFDLVLGGSFS